MKAAAIALAFALAPLSGGAQSLQSVSATGKGIASAVVQTALVRVDAFNVASGAPEVGLVDALRAAGVQDIVARRGAPLPTGSPVLTARGRIPGVSRERVDAIAAAVNGYAAAHAPIAIGELRFYGPAQDCPAVEQQARDAALADARRRAAAIAQGDGLRLGGQIAVAESGGCGQVGPSGGSFRLDISTMSLRVEVQETVTFATVK